MLNHSVLQILYLLSCYYLTDGITDSNQGCDKPEGSCLCYYELENSLLATELNRINLMTTFFPPEANPPEFVTIKYYFENSSTTQLWFWSAQTSHFIHPFQVFQFLSLFFSKPEPYYSGTVKLILKTECAELSTTDIHLQLLTQRLKLYAERNNSPSPTLIIKDTYNAKAYSKESLKNLLKKHSERITKLIICTAVLVVILSIIIMLVMMCMFFCSNSHTNSKWMKEVKKKKPAILSLTILSALANLYIISLASAAFHYWHQVRNNPNLIYDFDEKRNFAPLLIALITDILCFVGWIIVVVVSSICKCLGRNYVFVLSLTVLCPSFCIIAHSPYIAIAYLNDGNHASSIFIYYAILSYIFFAIAWSFFHWLEQYSSEEKLGLITCSTYLSMAPLLLTPGGELGEQDTENVSIKKNCCHGISCCCFVSIIFLLVTIVLLLALAVIITCYFVIIPINKAISDAPMRVWSIYQSGGFVIGSFIVYKVLDYFYGKKETQE